MDDDEGALAGSARLVLLGGVALLREDEQIFEAMLEGWRNQGLARNLARFTVQARERQVRPFQAHAATFPGGVARGRVVRGYARGAPLHALDGAGLPGRGARVLLVRTRSGVWLGRGLHAPVRHSPCADHHLPNRRMDRRRQPRPRRARPHRHRDVRRRRGHHLRCSPTSPHKQRRSRARSHPRVAPPSSRACRARPPRRRFSRPRTRHSSSRQSASYRTISISRAAWMSAPGTRWRSWTFSDAD